MNIAGIFYQCRNGWQFAQFSFHVLKITLEAIFHVLNLTAYMSKITHENFRNPVKSMVSQIALLYIISIILYLQKEELEI